MRDARRMILLWSMPIMNSWWDLKYLFVTMNVEEINDDYIDDDNVSRYRWRIEKNDDNKFVQKERNFSFFFFLFTIIFLLQHFSLSSSSSVYLIDRRWIWTIPFYLILLPHYHLLALDTSVFFLSLSFCLSYFDPFRPPPHASFSSFFRLSWCMEARPQLQQAITPTQLSVRRRKTVSSRSFLIAEFFFIIFIFIYLFFFFVSFSF